MEFIETRLQGAYLVRMKRIEDHRGFFARGFCREEFARQGLTPEMLQLNVGFSPAKGTLRGLHYQVAPHAEAKFIRCTRGAIFDVIVDIREGSPTRGQWIGAELTEDNDTMMYAPEGFAHGYQTLTDNAEMYYLTSAAYASTAARGLRFDDPAVSISWPIPVAVISDSDRTWPDYGA